MGVDQGHMSYERLAQSVPPQYGQLVFSQMCMRYACARFGAPAITFDEMQKRPNESRRQLAFWLRGAGAAEAELGQLFSPAPELAAEGAGSARAELHRDAGCDREAEFRELFYSHAGGFDQQWVRASVSGRLSRVSRGVTLEGEPSNAQLAGRNTFVELEGGVSLGFAERVAECVKASGAGTRMVCVVPVTQRAALEARGFAYLACSVGGKGPDALAYKGLVALRIGRRAGVSNARRLDHDAVRGHMDWRDRGSWEADATAKRDLTWEAFPHDPERYRGKGLPAWVEKMMVEGAVIDMEVKLEAEDVEQYAWASGEGLVEAILETDRHLTIGALEYVPDAEIKSVLEGQVVHPILLVSQGKGKFRACHDYSRGTNIAARSSPFALPAVWDVRAALKPGSYMCKYDLRDGFFAVPVHPDSRNKLVVRHPATGRLLRCARLPFGYVDSPRLFCGLTEAIADEVRRRTVGRGVYVYVFVDDFLIVGDDRSAASLGGETLEQVLLEFGIPWAPHKQRGPATCMEFLGLLVSNVPGHRCIALTEGRQKKLRSQIDGWLARRPGEEGKEVRVDVRELASFLGHLVFCSQVVPQGRTYMQAMLSQFAGLEVDWRRGEVRASKLHGAWHKGVSLLPGFWRDLEWWDERFESRNCSPIEVPARGEVAICGTDASDWGTGQLMWDSGLRAETSLRFTLAERARSINWRELLGIVRVLEQFGTELRGRTLLVEGDNTSSLAAAENASSKAEDSQELVRRLVELTEQFMLTVRFTHTPGVKLDRPDQTSRGDPIEEPMVRLKRSEYNLIERRWGPFSEWLGAERRYADAASMGGVTGGIWMHPSFSTVGSALRRLGERLGDREGERVWGVVIVPHDERAKWWPLVRHFNIAGRWERGSNHLELCRLSGWGEVHSQRASLILTFPRAAGSVVRPICWRPGRDKAGYVSAVEADRPWQNELYLPMPAGSFFYVPDKANSEKQQQGELMIMWECFDPATEGGATFDVGEPMVLGAEMLVAFGFGKTVGRQQFILDENTRDASGSSRGSFFDKGHTPWAWSAEDCWDVTHLVKYVNKPAGSGQRDSKFVWNKALQCLEVSFDWREAEGEIRSAQLASHPGPMSDEQLSRALVGDGEASGAREALEEARASAQEAAAARVRPMPAQRAGMPIAAVAKGPAPKPDALMRCKSAAMLCEGCHGLIGCGHFMKAGGRGMVHAFGDCLSIASERLASDVAAGERRPVEVTGLGAGSLKRHVQAEHRMSAERVECVMGCLSGKCKVMSLKSLMCIRSCGRGVHGLECCMLSAGTIALGNLTCAVCRADDLLAYSCTPPAKLVAQCTEAMVVELTTGSSNTHKGYSDLAMLERKWQADVCGGEVSVSAVRLPHTSAEGTYSFCLWLSKAGRRARSMGTTIRQLGSFCTKLGLVDYTKTGRVKALLKELENKGAAITTPDTQVTTAMIMAMYGANGTIRQVCSKVEAMAVVMTARETSMNDFELVGGMRVGEVLGGGEGHGLLANNACIQWVEDGPGSEHGVTIEARIEDSKTGFARWTVFTGKTEKSGIETAEHLRELWKVSGLVITKGTESCFQVERPNYWVVRVSLLDMNQDTFKRFEYEVRESSCRQIIEHSKATLHYAKQRRTAKTRGDEARYVNVAGGERDGESVRLSLAWLEEKGFGRYTDVVAGPLFRSTFGHSLSHMPYQPKSTHVHLVPAMERAFEVVQSTGIPDVEYDKTQDPEPKFGNHSNRRHADRVALRSALSEGDVSEEDVDFFFGWELKKMSEQMQKWYAGMDRVVRLRLSRVTKKM